jgi:hypothetical protein
MQLRKRPFEGFVGGETGADPGLYPWFRIGTLVYVLPFVAAGAALPYLIAEGTFGAPIVKTQAMEDC